MQDVYSFAQRQKMFHMKQNGNIVYPVWTSRRPARMQELLDGGSVYWVVKNQIQCRQRILDITDHHEDGSEKPAYLLLCDPQLIRTRPMAKKAFQGWRYLENDKAPADIGPVYAEDEAPPEDMARDLRAAGLL